MLSVKIAENQGASMSDISSASNLKDWIDTSVDKQILFCIPNYQRAYAWDEANVSILVEDLLSSNFDYFLGLLLLEKISPQQYALIDGQQRLTTIYLLLLAISTIAKFDSSKHSLKQIRFGKHPINNYLFYKNTKEPRLTLQEGLNQSLFSELIELNKKASSMEDLIQWKPNFNNSSEKKLLQAYQYLLQQLGELSIEQIEKIVRTLGSSHILVHVSENTGIAMRVFELLNDRGKKLTALEAIKCYSMNIVWNLTQNDSQFQELKIKKVKDLFSSIYSSIEAIMKHEKDFTGDEILRYFVITFANWTNKKQYGNAKELFKSHMKNQGSDVEKIISLISKLEICFKNLVVFYNKIFDSNDDEKWLKNVFLLNKMATFYPLIIAILARFPNDWSFLNRVCNYLEYFIFRGYLVLRRRSDAGEAKLFKLANQVINDSGSETEVKDLIIKSLINVIKDYCNDNEQNDEDFKQAINQKEFYKEHSATDVRYILVKFENELVNQMKQIQKKSNNSKQDTNCPYRKYLVSIHNGKSGLEYNYINEVSRIIDGNFSTIEHIVPQEEPTQNYYRKITKVKKEIKRYFDGDFEKKYLHYLGNLVYSTKTANIGKSNNFPEEKGWSVWLSQLVIKEFIDNRRRSYFNMPIIRNNKSKVSIKFTVKEIEERQKHFVYFMEHYWSGFAFDKMLNDDGGFNTDIKSKFENRPPLI